MSKAAAPLRGRPKARSLSRAGAMEGNLPVVTECFNPAARVVALYNPHLVMDPTILGNLATALTAWGATFLLALWASLVYWTYRDAQARLREPVRQWLAVLTTVVLFIPGVLVYLLLRPPRTLEEEYLMTLEEEALLRSIEESEGK